MRTALVVGEALIDEFPDRRIPAGAPLHVAAHLAALGWTASLVSRVGMDPDGEAILAVLAAHGLDPALVERSTTAPTGVTRISLAGVDHRFQVMPGAWDELHGPDPVPDVDLVYVGTLPLRSPRSRDAVERIVASTSATILIDLNVRLPDIDAERIRWAVEHADILKTNDEELALVCDALGLDHDQQALHALGPTWVCVTHGPSGATLTSTNGRRWHASSPPVTVVDTVGAGDAFCAALADGLVSGIDPGTVLGRATAAGAAIAGRRGGLPEPPIELGPSE